MHSPNNSPDQASAGTGSAAWDYWING